MKFLVPCLLVIAAFSSSISADEVVFKDGTRWSSCTLLYLDDETAMVERKSGRITAEVPVKLTQIKSITCSKTDAIQTARRLQIECASLKAELSEIKRREQAGKPNDTSAQPLPPAGGSAPANANRELYVPLDEVVKDTPARLQITRNIVVAAAISELQLRQLLVTLCEETKAREGSKHYEHPTHVDIYAYPSKEHHGDGWVGMISASPNQKAEPQVASAKLDALRNPPPRDTRFNLTEDQRRKIWREAVWAEECAVTESKKRYPEPSDVMKQMAYSDSLLEKYMNESFEQYKMTEDQYKQILGEALKENWPTPKPEE